MAKPPLILLVDDDENDLRMIRTALTRSGTELNVSCVHDGAEALEYLYRRGEFKDRAPDNPSMLLLDLNMPRADGWDVMRQVKADTALRNIPVVVFTSSARDQDVLHSYELGANAYVVKPIDMGEFMAAITDIKEFWAGRNQPPPETPAAPPPGPSRLPLAVRIVPT